MTVKLTDLFQEYELLVAKADQAFREMEKNYTSGIKCGIHCADCCHAVYGLFLIESVYINYQFHKLDDHIKQEIILRGDKFDQDLRELEKKVQEDGRDSEERNFAMEKARVRCPFLSDRQECRMYAYRPITCRVYGMPTVISGKVHVCWKSGFKQGESYPAFNFDSMNRELFELSKKLLEISGQDETDRAALLLSVSSSIKLPVEKLIYGM